MTGASNLKQETVRKIKKKVILKLFNVLKMANCQNKEQVECGRRRILSDIMATSSLQSKQSLLGMSPTVHLAAKFELIPQQYGELLT
jgi:hypothetical protein